MCLRVGAAVLLKLSGVSIVVVIPQAKMVIVRNPDSHGSEHEYVECQG